jgi:hypothetical protein
MHLFGNLLDVCCRCAVAVFAATGLAAGRTYAASAGGLSLPTIVTSLFRNIRDLFQPKGLVSEYSRQEKHEHIPPSVQGNALHKPLGLPASTHAVQLNSTSQPQPFRQKYAGRCKA